MRLLLGPASFMHHLTGQTWRVRLLRLRPRSRDNPTLPSRMALTTDSPAKAANPSKDDCWVGSAAKHYSTAAKPTMPNRSTRTAP